MEFKNKLCELKGLPIGWDGEDGYPPSSDILVAAESLMARLLCACSSNGESLDDRAKIPFPFASPLPDGRLQFEWRSERRYLELEFVDGNTISFLQNENDWFKIDYVQVEDTAGISRLLGWFMGP